MKISVLQFKSRLENIDENFLKAEKFINSAKNSDVIILPELWPTGYCLSSIEKFADINGQRAINFLSVLAKKNFVNIIGGSIAVKTNGKIFNRSLVFDRFGKLLITYDKTHLFRYAQEEKIFSAGNKISIVEIDKVKCALAICYDLRFPEFIRRIALTGVEIIFIPAAWDLKRLAPRQILTRARAIENQLFVVFANSLGKSEIIKPDGELLAEAQCGEEILRGEINPNERINAIHAMNFLKDRNLEVDQFNHS